MKRWEYTSIDCDMDNLPIHAADLGDEGWEMVGFHCKDESYTNCDRERVEVIRVFAMFKRPKVE